VARGFRKEQAMKRQGIGGPGLLSLSARMAVALVLAVAVTNGAAEGAEFEKAQLFIEFNSTDDDAGIQVLLDGEAWRFLRIFRPDGRVILELEAKRGLGQLGLTELFFESAEPSLDEVLAKFPAGRYKFEGITIKGRTLEGSAVLSHDIPPAPFFSPSSGELVDRSNTVITWQPIPGIARFQVIVENEDLGVSITVDLSGSVTELQVPPSFLIADTEYKAEVLAIAETGNRTIAEGTFKTLP
jgi:hypothetical protein